MVLKLFILPINKGFFIDWDFNNSDWDLFVIKIQLGLGFCQNFRWEMGLGPPPPSGPSKLDHDVQCFFLFKTSTC